MPHWRASSDTESPRARRARRTGFGFAMIRAKRQHSCISRRNSATPTEELAPGRPRRSSGGKVMPNESKPSVPHTYRVIGTRPIRHDGVDKVTGRAKYGADYAFPRMIHGKVLRSPHAHARIKSINID